jgi:cellulose synthase/poly-beta-1,6-N-acetylglucosamine synthase-like glycosyltransferase
LKLDKAWIALFFVVVALWFIVLASTIYPWIYGIEVLVDKEVDLTYLTLPLLGINMMYTLISIFIFATYLALFNKVKNYQLQMYKTKKEISRGNNNSNSNAIQQIIVNNTTRDYLCSIIIPARNEATVIKRTVMDCLQQTYKNIEIIVICHNSSDKTFEEAQVEDSRVKVFDLKTKEIGKGIALNYGIQKSNGYYILVLDGDGMLSKDFIEKALPLFESNCAAIQGRYIPSNRDYNLITMLLSIEGDLWSTPYMTIRSFLGKRCPLGGTGYIIRKDILIEVGRFTNHLVDDYELTSRLLKNNHRIVFAPLSINYDEKPPTFEFMLRQRARWGKGFINLLKQRVAKPDDIIGNIYWLTPIAAISGFIMLLIPGYAAIHNLLFEYYPYTYAFIPLSIWFLLTGVIYALQAIVLAREYPQIGLKYAAYLTIYNPFSHYWFVTFIKAFFVKSWADTKTAHGFVKEPKKMQKAVTNS